MKSKKLKGMKNKSVDEGMEEVEILIDTHFFNELEETQSPTFLKTVIENQNAIERKLL